MTYLCDVLRRQGQFTEAEQVLRGAMEGNRRVFGNNHPETYDAMRYLLALLDAQKRYADAEPLYAEIYRNPANATWDEVTVNQSIAQYGYCLYQLGRLTEAEVPFREVVARLRRVGPPARALMRDMLETLASVCERTNRVDEAVRLKAEADALGPTSQPAPTTSSTSATTRARLDTPARSSV